MVHALLPLKDLVTAKTRLSGVLRPSERRALAQAMVEDVLGTLTEHPQIASVTLVSDDPGADLLACKYGIEFLDERTLNCRGLNPILEKACDGLAPTSDTLTMILHGDIPLLSHVDIDAAVNRFDETGGLVIGCDRLSQGTNMLLFNSASRPEFCFGPGSCDKHLKSAQGRGIAVSILNTPGIGLDVDEPADLAMLVNVLAGDAKSYTAQLLLGTALGKRVQVQISTVANGPQFSVGSETRV